MIIGPVMRRVALLSLAATTAAMAQSVPLATVPRNFSVFEFRRYVVKAGEREHFAQLFEAYFPEAFEQVGAIAVGQGLERGNPNGFTWLRGFHSIEERASANAGFYYGPVWREHKKQANDLLVDNDNVLLLEPLSFERQPTILGAVDPVREPAGAQGVIVAQVFAVKANGVEALARAAESTFARYRATPGVREAGVLVTLDVENNYPSLKIRTDGPYLVWLGVVRDEAALHALAPLVERGVAGLTASGALRGAPEWIVMDPTHRSRLRWSDGNHD
jgi:hypothetical protein